MFVSWREHFNLLQAGNMIYSHKSWLYVLLVCIVTSGIHGSTSDTLLYSPDYSAHDIHLDLNDYLSAEKTPSSSMFIGKSYWITIPLDADSGRDVVEVIVPDCDACYIYYTLGDTIAMDSLGIIEAPRPASSREEVSRSLLDARLELPAEIYIRNLPSSTDGYFSLRKDIKIVRHASLPTHFQPGYKKEQRERDAFNFVLFNLTGMIVVLCIIMFMYFLFMKKRYFLWYTLYLFFLVFNYVHRTTIFENMIIPWNDHAVLYFNRNCQILANICYILFVRDFVNIRTSFPRLFPFYQGTIYFFVIFLVLYDIAVIYNPYFPYHEQIIIYFIYATALVSIGYVTYMFILSRRLYTAIVFVGSLLLLLGYLGAVIFANFFILVPVVVFEGLMIVGILTYLDLEYYKKAMERDKYVQINEMKSKFLTNIAHEVRTPLSIISTNLDLIENNVKQKEYIKRNLEKTGKFVDDLIVLSKLESGIMRVEKNYGNIVKHVELLLHDLRSLASARGIELVLESENQILICYDRNKIEHIITNLVNNGIKYSSKGDAVTVYLSYSVNLLRICVADTGIGIEDHKKSIVFQKFYRSKETREEEGFGVGLALVKELVQVMNGTIQIKDNSPSGTVCEVLLPALEAKYDKEAFISNTIYVNPDASSIVLVDDDRDFLEFMKETLSQHYKVYTTAYSSLALELISLKKPDIIILDYQMPDISGVELISLIKKKASLNHIPIICMSSYTEDSFKNKMLSAGALSVLEKPVNYSILINSINNILNSKYSIRPVNEEPAFTSWKDELNNLINEHGSRLTVAEIADKLYISRSQLHRKIKTEFQMSSSEYVKHLVVLRAQKLLSQELSVTQVSEILGFKSVSQFSTTFKNITGNPPSKW